MGATHLLSERCGLLVGREQHELARIRHRQAAVRALAAARNLFPAAGTGYKEDSTADMVCSRAAVANQPLAAPQAHTALKWDRWVIKTGLSG